MDLEANVCAKSTTSLQILPHLTKVYVMHVGMSCFILIMHLDEARSDPLVLQVLRKGSLLLFPSVAT